MSEKLPEAISESEIEIFGIVIRVYQLDDGRRVIHADDFEKFMELIKDSDNENSC